MLRYISTFKFVRNVQFCVSAFVKRYHGVKLMM